MFDVFIASREDATLDDALRKCASHLTFTDLDDGRIVIEDLEEQQHCWFGRDDAVKELFELDQMDKMNRIAKTEVWSLWHLEFSFPKIAVVVLEVLLRIEGVLAVSNDCGLVLGPADFLSATKSYNDWPYRKQ